MNDFVTEKKRIENNSQLWKATNLGVNLEMKAKDNIQTGSREVGGGGGGGEEMPGKFTRQF